MVETAWLWLSVGLLSATCVVLASGWRRAWLDRDAWRLRAGKASTDEADERKRRVALELEHAGRRLNVAALVPAHSRAKASDATAGFLRKAFRAHVAWHIDCPAILPFAQLLCAAELDDDARHVMACELYARAILECAMALHLDGANPRSDRAVLAQLHDALGEEFAARVRSDVEARGVVFDEATTEAPVARSDPH